MTSWIKQSEKTHRDQWIVDFFKKGKKGITASMAIESYDRLLKKQERICKIAYEITHCFYEEEMIYHAEAEKRELSSLSAGHILMLRPFVCQLIEEIWKKNIRGSR